MNNMNNINNIDTQIASKNILQKYSTKLQNTTGILQEDIEIENENTDKCEILCIKIVAMILIFIILVPLSILDLYYYSTDKYCIHENNKFLSIDLSIYLVVDGVLGSVGAVLWILFIYLFHPDEYIIVIKGYIMKFIIIFVGLFNLSWTIVGSILFWMSTKNEECSKGVYNYIFTLLIIRYTLLTLSFYNQYSIHKT
jgi:hypothetical protein